MSLEEFGYHEELRRVLTTRDLIIYGMIFMVPIAPFSVYGFVWDDAKGMVPLAYLVGLVGMVFTALSYAAMSRAFPLAGSVYTYARRGLHEVAGFFSGWLILLDYMLVLELATLAAFLAMGLIALYGRGEGAGGLTLAPIYDPRVFSWATVSGATSIAVLSFLGFDGISTLSEENRGKENAVGRATVIALLLVGALFMLQTWVATDLARGMHFSSPETAFYEIAQRAGGTWLKLVVIVAVVIASAIANAMAAQAAVARILFAMARDGKLPAVLAKVHPRFKTPYISTLVVAGVSVLVGAFFFQRIDDLTRVVNFGALSGFVLLHLSVINHFFVRQRSGDWLRHLAFPLVGLAIILYVLYEMDRAAKILGACWIAIGALYYGVLALRGRHLIGAESGGSA
jgi:amino acid transporter